MGFFDRFKLPSVNVPQAREYLDQGAVMLDVRENNEWNAGRVPGAVHVPFAQVGTQAARRLPKGRIVIVACRSGNRSRSATRMLRERGIEAYSLSGGLRAWEREGQRIVGKSATRAGAVI